MINITSIGFPKIYLTIFYCSIILGSILGFEKLTVKTRLKMKRRYLIHFILVSMILFLLFFFITPKICFPVFGAFHLNWHWEIKYVLAVVQLLDLPQMKAIKANLSKGWNIHSCRICMIKPSSKLFWHFFTVTAERS